MNAETRQEKWAVAIAQAEQTFTEIAVADGNLVNYQREASFALQCVGGSDELQKCDTESLRNAIVNVASVGLTINPAMKLAYLVPRKGKACLDISYIGLVKIATDSGGVLAVAATLVRANDSFVYRGPFEAPIHNFDPFANEQSRGEIIGVYTTAKLASGVTQIEVIGRQEIDKIRAMSKAKSGPWFDWFEEMAKKAIIKRASKLWPRTERLAKAEQILNEHQGNETIIDGATGEVIPAVAMPQSRSAAKAPAAPASPPGSPPPPGDAGGGAAPGQNATTDRVLTDGERAHIRAKLEAGALTETDVKAKFGVGIDGLMLAQFQSVKTWMKNPAG